MKKVTEELLNELASAANAAEYLAANIEEFNEAAFTTYLKELINSSGLRPATIMSNAGLSSPYYYNIINGERQPQRDTVLKLSIGLKLNVAEAQRLLKLSGHGEMYPRRKRDSVIYFCIQKGHDLTTANEILSDFDLQLLS